MEILGIKDEVPGPIGQAFEAAIADMPRLLPIHRKLALIAFLSGADWARRQPPDLVLPQLKQLCERTVAE